jgi:hypothetical protein
MWLRGLASLWGLVTPLPSMSKVEADMDIRGKDLLTPEEVL